MLTFGILSIGVVVSNSAAAAFIIPPSVCNNLSLAYKPAQSRTWQSTNIFFRDEDSFDAMGGAERSTKRVADKSSDFQSRMKSLVVKQRRSTSPRGNKSLHRPKNVKTAVSLEEFAAIIEEGRREDKVIVVRFHATWCKKCHSIRLSFDKAASSNPEVIFVDVPVLNTNSNLHKGLGVESVPFGHIYHPTNGLVEETKLSRKTFSEFEDLVKMHCS